MLAAARGGCTLCLAVKTASNQCLLPGLNMCWDVLTALCNAVTRVQMWALGPAAHSLLYLLPPAAF